MLAIKLQRIGKKHQPSYRVVVALKKSKMAAPPVEDLGAYNPFTKASTVKKDRVSYWVGKGAQATVSVHNLLVKEGIVSAAKMKVKIPKAILKTPEAPAAAVEEKAAALEMSSALAAEETSAEASASATAETK